MTPGIYTIIGILLTFSIFLSNVIFKTGHISARVEALEKWRIDIRNDMHEISDELKNMSTALKELSTLIEERTDRRIIQRDTISRDK